MKERTERIPTTNIPTFKDRMLICAECYNEFFFTAGEQQFFWSRNLIEPKRCPACRALRKATAAGNNHNREHNVLVFYKGNPDKIKELNFIDKQNNID
jgi:hypothetical protein